MNESLMIFYINIANIYIKVQFCNKIANFLKNLFPSMIISHFHACHLFKINGFFYNFER